MLDRDLFFPLLTSLYILLLLLFMAGSAVCRELHSESEAPDWRKCERIPPMSHFCYVLLFLSIYTFLWAFRERNSWSVFLSPFTPKHLGHIDLIPPRSPTGSPPSDSIQIQGFFFLLLFFSCTKFSLKEHDWKAEENFCSSSGRSLSYHGE